MQGLRGTHLAHDFLGQGLPLYSQAEARAAPLESKERRIKGHAANVLHTRRPRERAHRAASAPISQDQVNAELRVDGQEGRKRSLEAVVVIIVCQRRGLEDGRAHEVRADDMRETSGIHGETLDG